MDTPSTPNQPSKNSRAVLWAVLIVIIIAAIGVAVYLMTRNTTNTNNANENTNTTVNQNTNSAASTNSGVNSSSVSENGPLNQFNNSVSGVSFSFPNDWTIAEDSVTDMGHEIRLTKGEGADKATPHDNNAVINLNVLNRDAISGYDWPEGVGGSISTSQITINGKETEERISESTNPLAFPDNSIPQLSSGVLLTDGSRVFSAALYTGGADRRAILSEFEHIVESLRY